MTPEKARDMLQAAGADGFTAPEMCITPELIDHAPIMAEQIANMRYEYAVQVTGYNGETRLASTFHSTTRNENKALWTGSPYTELADYWRATTTRDVCIVRRLVGEPEVTE